MKHRGIFFPAFLLFVMASFSVNANAQHAQPNVQPPCNPDLGCLGHGGGGGGIGGGGGSSQSQELTWGNYSTSYQDVRGVGGRLGVGATALYPNMYVAYTGPVTNDSKGDSPVYVAQAGDGLGTDIGTGYQVTLSGSQTVESISNPALANDGTNLYLAWIDGYNNLGIVKSQGTTLGTSGYNWGSSLIASLSGVYYSPSLAVYNQHLFAAATNAADNTLWVGTLDLQAPNAQMTWTNFPDKYLGFNPALGVFNNQVYIAVQAGAPGDGTHDLYYWTTQDGQNLTFYTSANSDSTSTAPSLAVHGGTLYMGFRTNDGDHKFIYKYSTDGVNWSGNAQGNAVMNGNPTLVDGKLGSTSELLAPADGYLYNIYVLDDGTNRIAGGWAN